MAGSPSLGAGVKFDAVVFLRRDGTARVTTFVGAACTGVEIRAGTAAIAGNTICGSISGALLGSTGFAKSDYTWNLWPRIGATNNTISDFAPNIERGRLGRARTVRLCVDGARPGPRWPAAMAGRDGVTGFH